jgi:hypothetical protein
VQFGSGASSSTISTLLVGVDPFEHGTVAQKVADFGLACAVNPQTLMASTAGTLFYLCS